MRRARLDIIHTRQKGNLMKAIIKTWVLGLFISGIAACQTLEEAGPSEEATTEAATEATTEAASRSLGEQSHAALGAEQPLLGLCRNVCTYGNCGECSFAGGNETNCYIWNGCGGKYPTP